MESFSSQVSFYCDLEQDDGSTEDKVRLASGETQLKTGAGKPREGRKTRDGGEGQVLEEEWGRQMQSAGRRRYKDKDEHEQQDVGSSKNR